MPGRVSEQWMRMRKEMRSKEEAGYHRVLKHPAGLGRNFRWYSGGNKKPLENHWTWHFNKGPWVLHGAQTQNVCNPLINQLSYLAVHLKSLESEAEGRASGPLTPSPKPSWDSCHPCGHPTAQFDKLDKPILKGTSDFSMSPSLSIGSFSGTPLPLF